MPAWNGWYHCMANTYGTWLPGDPRGFRTRQHREHVEGDYKQPPPTGKYDQRHQVARQRMKREAVWLSPEMRERVLREMVEAFQRYEVELLAVSVSANHMHVLGRFLLGRKPTLNGRGLRTSALDDPVRHLMGKAKQWSAKKLAMEGQIKGGVWARKGKIVPVRDRAHQVNVYRYVLKHAREDAAVWSFNDQ